MKRTIQIRRTDTTACIVFAINGVTVHVQPVHSTPYMLGPTIASLIAGITDETFTQVWLSHVCGHSLTSAEQYGELVHFIESQGVAS